MGEPTVTRVVIDLRRNRLVLELDEVVAPGAATGTVDIGALGRLLGVEVGGVYLAVSDAVPGSELQGRSASVTLEVDSSGRRVAIPRRGEGWELSFPSGNSCWQRGDGTLCSTVIAPDR